MSVYSQIEKGLLRVLKKDRKIAVGYIHLKHELALKKSDKPARVLLGLLILCHKHELQAELDRADAIERSLLMLREDIQKRCPSHVYLLSDTHNNIFKVLSVYQTLLLDQNKEKLYQANHIKSLNCLHDPYGQAENKLIGPSQKNLMIKMIQQKDSIMDKIFSLFDDEMEAPMVRQPTGFNYFDD